MNNKILLIFCLTAFTFCVPIGTRCQGTAINETGAISDPSAILDIDQQNSGILIPRLTTEEIQTIHSPAHGLWVFNTTDQKFYIFNSDINLWEELSYEAPTNNHLTDPRDQRIYKTILAGPQLWMAENLNAGKMVNRSRDDALRKIQHTEIHTIEKFCYKNIEANCDRFGGLYEWQEVTRYINSDDQTGICPAGWHIPSESEFNTLFNYANNDTLKHFWETNRTDNNVDLQEESLPFMDIFNTFWISTSTSAGKNIRKAGRIKDGKITYYSPDRETKLPVRCIKDH